MKRYLIIDVYGSSRGHAVNYIQCLADLLTPYVNLTLWLTPSLCAQIHGRVKKVPAIRWIGNKGILVRLSIALSLIFRSFRHYDAVFFSSFDEFVLLLLGNRRLRRCGVLITNNLRNVHRIRLLALRYVLGRVKRIFVHTEYQKEWLHKNLFLNNDQIIVIPHYSIGFDRGTIDENFKQRQRIICLGDSRRDKRLDKFIELIASDLKGNYQYGLYGDVQLSDEETLVLQQKDVPVERRYLSRNDYFKLLKKAKFVVLLYDKSFTLRVSGIFFDAISCLVPVIASRIPSFSSYFDRFGELGVLVDEDEPDWINAVLQNDLSRDYERYVANIRNMKLVLNHERLKRDYLSLLPST